MTSSPQQWMSWICHHVGVGVWFQRLEGFVLDHWKRVIGFCWMREVSTHVSTCVSTYVYTSTCVS
jgi:hypothetical protein